MKRLFKALLNWIILLLTRAAYEKHTLDRYNKKMIEPIPGLIINGRQMYKFVNPEDMPESRFVNFLAIRQELAMGISRDLLVEYILKLRQSLNDADVMKAGQLLYMLEDTATNCVPTEAVYQLAALRYFDRQEDLVSFDGDYNQRKIEGFKAFKDQSFFLRTLSRDLMQLGVELPADIEAFLKTHQSKLKMYEQILSGKGATKP